MALVVGIPNSFDNIKSLAIIGKELKMSFKSVQKKIEKEGYSKGSAGAILAKKTREASPAAKKKNPKLKRVKG